MTSVLVIGGTRFIGPPTVSRLLHAGAHVTVLHRGSTESELPDGVDHIHAEREDAPKYAKDLRPDVLLDMVPVFEEHGEGDLATAEAGDADRVVMVSSCDVYRAYDVLHGHESEIQPNPIDEDNDRRQRLFPYQDAFDEGHPMRRYDKIPIEDLVVDAGGTTMRLPAVHGPGDYQHRLYGHARRMSDDRPFILIGEDHAQWRWSRGFVDNVAEAISIAVLDDRAAGLAFNVADNVESEIEWIRRIAGVMGWNGDVLEVEDSALPEALQAGADVNQDLVVSTARIRSLLDYNEPVGQHAAIEATVEWELANPPEQPDLDYEDEDRLAATLG